MLRVKLPHLDRWAEARQAAARRYDALIEEHELDSYLLRPMVQAHRRHVFNQYVVRVARGQRDALVRHFRAEKIGCEVYYPIPLHRQVAYRHYPVVDGGLPVSEQLAAEVISLPMHPYLDAATQDRIIEAVRHALRG